MGKRGQFLPSLLHRAWVEAKGWGVQTGRRVTQVGFFNPEQWCAILAFLILAGAPALVAHQQNSNEQNAKDGEGVEENEIEKRVV